MLRSRWLIVVPVALLAVFARAQPVQAVDGVTAVGYYITDIPPAMSEQQYEQCGTTIYPNINWTWDYEQNHLGACGWDSFAVHFTGNITIPDGVQSVQFMIAHDDGAWVTIGDTQLGGWYDQGCSWSSIVQLQVTQQTLPLDMWFYENGGNTCAMLAWQLDNNDWEIVPAWAFTTTSTPPTTTTTTTATTTTVPVTNPTTTTVQQTTTSTTATTTTTVPELPTTTTSQPPLVQTTTTTSTTTTTTTTLPATTTTQALTAPVITQAPTTTDEPTTTYPSTTTTEPTPQPTEQANSTSSTTTFIQPTTTVDEPLAVDVPIPTEPTQIVEPELVVTEETIEEATTNIVALVALVANLDDASDEQIEAVINAVLADEVTAEEATVLATSSEVLAQITQEQASEVFAVLQLDELSVNEIDQIIEAVQSAPVEVREAFETEINIFDGKTDTYVALGSTISVGARRVLVATTGVLIAGSIATSTPQSHTSRKNG